MAWVIAAAVAAVLIYRFFTKPSRRVKALCFSAMHARHRQDWQLAAKFYAKSFRLTSKLKEPARSKAQPPIEIQWAGVLYRQGNLSEAEDMLGRAQSSAERYYPRNSEMLLEGHLLWGDLCADRGRHSEAEGHYRIALEGDESNHCLAGMIFDLQRLADCLIRQERRAQAERVIERAIALETRHAREYAASHRMDFERHGFTPLSLPRLHFCREQYEDAGRLYRAQVQHWEKQVKRPANIDIGHMQMQVALAEERAGHYEEAIDAYARAAAEFEREWCEGHPKAAAAREAKAALEAGAAHLALPRCTTF